MKNWLDNLQAIERFGEIEQCIGLKLVANGPPQCFVGERCEILNEANKVMTTAEVIGFAAGKVYLMPFTQAPVRMGFKVRASNQAVTISISDALIGKVINAAGELLDGFLPRYSGIQLPLHTNHINPLARAPVTEQLFTGINIIDSLLPLGKGQRVGLFAGSGVGKSVLLGMIARRINSDINVIALVGERGREVNDFISSLDSQTLAKSIIVVACSDDFALMRRQAVYTATAIAEYFCKQGKAVMLMMDSITRFAMAQREIALSLGEPPTTRGYTPSVFAMLPGIVERAGNLTGQGSITALYTVLVEGDDFNEPIADTMRSLLDGHIVLTRELAQRGHYPAIDPLQSISRLSQQILTPEKQQLNKKILNLLTIYRQNRDLVELGVYNQGTNPKLDYALQRIDNLQNLFCQNIDESLPYDTLIQRLQEVLQ
ncbi:FliI/YscN family ATPase [Legionella dresdenensis]|uniref:protein-secreting ATPase n=1 Tax=Legionella dresdenensis TaxID=450200 RepID=A0ABV8CHL0_9GAMM